MKLSDVECPSGFQQSRSDGEKCVATRQQIKQWRGYYNFCKEQSDRNCQCYTSTGSVYDESRATENARCTDGFFIRRDGGVACQKNERDGWIQAPREFNDDMQTRSVAGLLSPVLFTHGSFQDMSMIASGAEAS
jgi:hypothetical protein